MLQSRGGRVELVPMRPTPQLYVEKSGAGGGGLRTTHYYRMHASRGYGRMGVWRYVCNNSALSLSLCRCHKQGRGERHGRRHHLLNGPHPTLSPSHLKPRTLQSQMGRETSLRGACGKAEATAVKTCSWNPKQIDGWPQLPSAAARASVHHIVPTARRKRCTHADITMCPSIYNDTMPLVHKIPPEDQGKRLCWCPIHTK